MKMQNMCFVISVLGYIISMVVIMNILYLTISYVSVIDFICQDLFALSYRLNNLIHFTSYE